MDYNTPNDRDKLNEIGSHIIGAAFEVRKSSGRYFKEKYYKLALAYELNQIGHYVAIEQSLAALYKGIAIQDAFKMDLVIDDCVIIETKAMHHVGDPEFRQLLSYLKLSEYHLGYLINFGAENFQIAQNQDKYNLYKGIYRFVNRF